jgi:hypothetical protein
MPRNPTYVALDKLATAKLNFDRVNKAQAKARSELYGAMVKAVELGVTRSEVGKMVGVTAGRVAQIPGMPAGANTHKKSVK